MMQESEIAVGTSGHRQTDCDSILMEKEEPLNLRATAVSQLTSYDHMEYCWHSYQIKIKMVSPLIRDKSRVLAKEYRTVVPIYPKVAGEQEKWVAIYGYSRRIDVDVEQPDPERQAIYGNNIGMFGVGGDFITYWYADELPYWIAVIVVCALVSIIFAPPVLQLCLTICFSFMIYKLIQVRKPSQKNLPSYLL